MSTSIPYTFAAGALALLSICMMSLFNFKNHFPVRGRTVVVTGGSQGLGLAVAQKLAAKGANVVIVAQNVDKLERAVASIKSAASDSAQRFLHLSFDLRSPTSASEILTQVTKWNQGEPPDIVWCCAGLSHPGFFADLDIETLRGQMDTVYWTCAYIAHATINLWTKQSESECKTKVDRLPRHLIFTSSVVAFFPMAGYAAYTPAKAAMRALADSLQQEVAVYNGARQRGDASAPEADIKVHTIFPCGIASPGFENEEKIKPQLTIQLEKDDKPQKPEECAEASIKGLEAGEYLVSTMLLGTLLKGAGMGTSLRSGVVDMFWAWLGSIVILFVGPDFVSKCKRWGKDNGLKTGPA